MGLVEKEKYMSHYTVAVITKTNPDETYELEELLAPFDEDIEVEPYLYRTKEQIIEESRKRRQQWIDIITDEKTSNKELVEYLTKPGYKWLRKLLNADTDEEFYQIEVCEDMVGEDGNEYSTYSKDSRWDWWSIGGRWGASLRDYNGEYHDTLRIADWDYNYIDPEDVNYYSRFWEIVVEGVEPTEEEKDRHWTLYKPEYYIEKYGNKSNFVKAQLTFSTYALLTPDGEWLEPGKVGWWGLSNADPADEGEWERDFISLIGTFNKDYYITIVDCHI